MKTSYLFIINWTKQNPGKFLFFFFLFVACFTYQNYGVSWDENTQRITGKINYEYAFEDNDFLLEWKDKDYGAAWELPLIFIEKAFGLEDFRDIFLMRHFMTHLLFLFAALCFYKLIMLLYSRKSLAVIGFLMLVLHPIIYMHSFYNSKDLPFLSLFIIVFYLAAKAFKSKTYLNFIYLGIATGLLIGIRIMGIMVPIFIFILFLFDMFFEKKVLKNLQFFGLFLLFTLLLTYISWPYLWEDPMHRFITSFENMSKFRLEITTLINGEYILTQNTPWYFFPVWFLLTNPIIFLIFGFLGILTLLFCFVKNPLDFIKNTPNRNYLMIFGVFSGSIFMVIYLESVLYDQWRQLYFIYPSFILVLIFGLSKIQNIRLQKISFGVIGFSFVLLLFHSIRMYPLQHVYFNYAVNQTEEEYIRKTWEMDYWGVSYYWALKYILKHDNTDQITISFDHLIGQDNLKIMHESERARFQIRDPYSSDYFIVNYRWHPHDFDEFKKYEFHHFKFGNSTFCTIFKMKD